MPSTCLPAEWVHFDLHANYRSLLWLHTQLCSLSLLMWMWKQWQLLKCLIGLAVFFKVYFNGTGVRGEKGRCLRYCLKMPSMSPSARYTLSRNRSLLHFKLALSLVPVIFDCSLAACFGNWQRHWHLSAPTPLQDMVVLFLFLCLFSLHLSFYLIFCLPIAWP